jgi:hypothetical protein
MKKEKVWQQEVPLAQRSVTPAIPGIPFLAKIWPTFARARERSFAALYSPPDTQVSRARGKKGMAGMAGVTDRCAAAVSCCHTFWVPLSKGTADMTKPCAANVS